MAEASTAAAQLALARKLWHSGYDGVLSTHSVAQPGYPFGSLTPLCRTPQACPLLLLSHLAQHTQNLQANPNCSLILLEKGEGDVQQLGRLTCLAQAETVEGTPALWKERYFQHFPDTRHYHEALNFRFYRLIPQRFYFIGGFGAARWFDVSRLLSGYRFSEAEERRLLPQVLAIYRDSPRAQQARDSGVTEIVGVDSHGIDIRLGAQLSRIQFESPTDSVETFLKALRARLAS